MNPPSIRYPLPTLAAILLAALLAWKGEAWTRPARSRIAAWLAAATAAPPVPASVTPMKVAGPLPRRGLLLSDGIVATDVPGGKSAETIRLRQFVDVYDVWPASGPATHVRVGNRRPWGWVRSEDFLDWPQRLVILGPPASRPVLGASADGIRLTRWAPGRVWQEAEGEEALPAPAAARWGVWLSRQEWLTLMGLLARAPSAEAREEARLRAISGALASSPAWTPREADAVAAWLPGVAKATRAASPATALEALARGNEDWTPEASWSGLEFRALPLSDLP